MVDFQASCLMRLYASRVRAQGGVLVPRPARKFNERKHQKKKEMQDGHYYFEMIFAE